MTMTEPKAPARPLPDGWSVDARRDWCGLGWTVDGVFDLDKAADYVQAEAKTFPTGVVYDPVIVRRWSLFRRRTIRWVERAVIDVETACPRAEWLDARFASGGPDVVLAGFANGDPITLKYHPGRTGPVEPVHELSGYLCIRLWTSIGMTFRAYSIEHDLPGQDGSNTRLSEFGIVWDARPLT
jgi:hypothetical protein